MQIKKEDNIIYITKFCKLISKQIRKDILFDQLIKEIIDEFCQCFQAIISFINSVSSIQVC